MSSLKQNLYITGLAIVLGTSVFAYAQTNSANIPQNVQITEANPSSFTGPGGVAEIEEQIYYNLYPSKPQIGDEIEISAEMYGTEPKNAVFTWVVGGKTLLSGPGQVKLNFVLTEKTTVNLTIQTGQGNIIKKSWNFNPQKTVIVWESNTYTPPFYKGKSLYTPESSLVLHAINLDTENPLTNTYADYIWKVDGTVQGDLSGVAKNTYVYKGDLLVQEPLFQVTTSGVKTFNDRANSTIDSEASLRVQTFNTDIFSYENNLLLGVLFNKQIQESFALNKSEASIVAYPAYFGLSSSLAGQYEWYVNDTLVKQNSNVLSFKKTRDNEESRLSISIKNQNSLLQGKDISYIIDTSKVSN